MPASLHLPHCRVSMTGAVRAPLDMMVAARASLSAAGFEALMTETHHHAPTPEQLCAAVERERTAQAATD